MYSWQSSLLLLFFITTVVLLFFAFILSLFILWLLFLIFLLFFLCLVILGLILVALFSLLLLTLFALTLLIAFALLSCFGFLAWFALISCFIGSFIFFVRLALCFLFGLILFEGPKLFRKPNHSTSYSRSWVTSLGRFWVISGSQIILICMNYNWPAQDWLISMEWNDLIHKADVSLSVVVCREVAEVSYVSLDRIWPAMRVVVRVVMWPCSRTSFG